jgi:hypothetical protein
MKNLLLAVTLLLSTNVFAVDAYSTEDAGVKKLIKQVITTLKAPNSVELEKKIHKTIKSVFTDTDKWNAYWFGYNDLSISKIKDPEVGFIEYFINTEGSGMFFVSFMYDKKSNQILVSSKQIRYGDKQIGLDLFLKKKGNTEEYEVRHERDSYALVQDKGKVDFTAFNIGPKSASVIYFKQEVIDL